MIRSEIPNISCLPPWLLSILTLLALDIDCRDDDNKIKISIFFPFLWRWFHTNFYRHSRLSMVILIESTRNEFYKIEDFRLIFFFFRASLKKFSLFNRIFIEKVNEKWNIFFAMRSLRGLNLKRRFEEIYLCWDTELWSMIIVCLRKKFLSFFLFGWDGL